MSQNSTIEWTDATWSPLRVKVRTDAAAIAESKGYTSLIQIGAKMAGRVGQHCEHVSDGCKLCYSGTWQARCLKSGGTGLPFDRRSRDLVEPFVDEKTLLQPLKWPEPQKIFVENQSDLFGEWYTDEQIDRVFAVMAVASHHTFQVLTKRPERMLEYISTTRMLNVDGSLAEPQILPNVHLGVSVENQATADERIPLLLRTPAAVRFVSYEPALGPVDFTRINYTKYLRARLVEAVRWSAEKNGLNADAEGAKAAASVTDKVPERERPNMNALTGEWFDGWDAGIENVRKLDWIIIGGESGSGARPFDIQWARDTVEQCSASGVACFVKQLGARPYWPLVGGFGRWADHVRFTRETSREAPHHWDNIHLKSRKGGEMSEWPEDLRVREFPKC